jgi:hypothetical protein
VRFFVSRSLSQQIVREADSRQQTADSRQAERQADGHAVPYIDDIKFFSLQEYLAAQMFARRQK